MTEDVVEKKARRRRGAAWVVLATVATVVTLIQGYSLNTTHDLAVSNKALLQADADQRAENRDRFAQSDRALCNAIEKLNTERRQSAIQGYRMLDETLDLLGVTKTEKIVRVAKARRDATLLKFKARKGGCGSLPSTGVKRGPAETGKKPPVATTP